MHVKSIKSVISFMFQSDYFGEKIYRRKLLLPFIQREAADKSK